MPENIVFSICESLRNIKNLSRHSVNYLFSLLISHLLLIVVFIIYINTYYYRYITVESKAPVVFIIVFCILAIAVSSIFIYINQGYIKKYLENNRNELKLIRTLKGSTNFIRTPLFVTCFSLNFTAFLIIFNYVAYFYRYLMDNMDYHSLLDFNYYDTSLFIVLLLFSTILLFCVSWFLFRRFEKQ